MQPKRERFSCTSPERKQIENQERIYNQHVRLLPPSPLVVCASKVYSGLGADIVYGIITLRTLNERNRLVTSVTETPVILGLYSGWRSDAEDVSRHRFRNPTMPGRNGRTSAR
jgi:hypothetical protein